MSGQVLALALILRRDMIDGGALSIIEDITRLGEDPPQSRRIRLCDQVSGRMVREAWSDPDYNPDVISFHFLREGPWILYGLDHTQEHEAVIISDRLATSNGLRP